MRRRNAGNPDDVEPRLYTVPQACKYVCCGVNAMYR
jgi:hypothetical protein